MREAIERIQRTAEQLSITDKLLESYDNEYKRMRKKLLKVSSYPEFLKVIYHGQTGRQMVLGDLFEYIITGRGYWLALQGKREFRDYIRIILYLINLVTIQESVFSFKTEARQEILSSLKKAGIEDFFISEEEKKRFSEFEKYDGRIMVTGETRSLYKVMDSLTPKPIGAAIELIVYIYLMNRRIGYIAPLLLSQSLLGGEKIVAPPDYLLLPGNGRAIGIEVGGGMGQYSLQQGKIDQANLFIQETGIPIITAGVPHIYRCETCQCWITFCDEVIKRTSCGESDLENINCVKCPKYDNGHCSDIIYYGQIERNGIRRRHHYYHFTKQHYVQETGLSTSKSRMDKLIQYFPVVRGLENLPSIT
ncbi:hypothetical protein ACFLXA_01590 [Chloroflexota bacterium]